MDTTNETKQTDGTKDSFEKDYGGKCCGRHGHRGFWAGRLIVAILLIAIVFGLGIAAGSFKSMGRNGFKSFGPSMMNRGYNMMGGYKDSGFGRNGMMGWYGVSNQNTSQISGAISKIEGAKITVIDNGNQEKVILSTSTTQIVSASGQISLSALKAGQNISAVGTMKDSQLEATVIRAY